MDQLFPQVTNWLDKVLARTKDHAVVFLSPGGDILAWLGAAERVFGHSAVEATGQPFAVLFVPEDRALDLHLQEMEVARQLGRSEDDRWHLRRDGGRFWANGTLEAVVGDGGELLGYCKLVRDRTDVHMQTVALQNLVQAQKAERGRHADHVATLLHELRNAVGPARNTVQALRRTQDAAAATSQAYDLLDRQIDVMARLLDDGMDAWLADPASAANRASVVRKPIVLQDALRLAADALRPAAAQRRQALDLIVPTPPIAIDADPARLHQMVVNLLGNAVKYTPEGGRVSLTGTVEGAMAVIRVEDDGVGIAPEVLPHVFELFTREARSAGGADGLGVGLALVKEYASLHGGTVEARSPGVGQGTIVAVRLPLGSAAAGTSRVV